MLHRIVCKMEVQEARGKEWIKKYTVVYARSVEYLVDELNEFFATFNRPYPNIVYNKETGLVDVNTAKYSIRNISDGITKTLGLGVRDLARNREYEGYYEASLPNVLPVVVCMDMIEPGSIVPSQGSTLLESALTTLNLRIGKDFSGQKLVPDWIKLSKTSVSNIIITIRYVESGEVVHCLEWLNDFVLYVHVKPRLTLRL